MSRRADATLAAVVANVAATGTRWLFRPADVAPVRRHTGARVRPDTVARHMRAAGYAVPARGGWLELTPAGLDAVEAARAATSDAPANVSAAASPGAAARPAGRRAQAAPQLPTRPRGEGG